ncbi:MAG: hypothetical protein GY811_12315 [Myxococcales bacterium]|nr:hypothetical protein [Myxococcales bacterium]
MPRLPFTLSSIALASVALAGTANAQHEVQAYLSQEGLDFIADEAPGYIPSVFEAPKFVQELGCMEFEQRNTTINLNIDDVRISMPEDGRVRVDIEFSGGADGELYVDDLYACLGEVTCRDSLDIRNGSASFDYELAVRDGQAVVLPRHSEIHLLPESVEFNLADCGMTGDALTAGIGFAEDWILGFLNGKMGDIADGYVAPLLENMLDGFRTTGSLAIASYGAEIADLEVENDGVFLRMAADVSDNFAPDACIAEYDNGGPLDFDGPQPNLSAPGASHASLAVNLGLANRGLYTFWRRGLLCLSDDHLRALGVELDLNMIGAMLPGFPAGTEIGFEMKMTDYPKVVPSASQDSQITLKIDGLMLDLHGDRPDGTRKTLNAEIDIEVTATVGIDPSSNSIFAGLDNAQVTRMVIKDERDATGSGFDVARILQMLHNHILPGLLHEVGALPLTGPAFSFEGYAVILRELQTSDAFLTAGVDLFRVPESDNNAPDTQIVSFPTGPVNPHTAEISVSGSDTQIPSELLQYEMSINGVKQEASFMHTFKIGEIGATDTYFVEVAAVDLSGNVDPTPDTVELTVDGIVPHVAIAGARTREADQGPVAIDWSVSDDVSAPADMNIRLEVYVLDDPADALSARLIDTQELGKGATNTTVHLEQVGGIYRVEVHAVDQAGNDSKSSLLLTIPSSGGCSVGGSAGAGNMSLLLLALGALFIRRRREA